MFEPRPLAVQQLHRIDKIAHASGAAKRRDVLNT